MNAGRLAAAESWLDDAERALAAAGEPEPPAGWPNSALATVPATVVSVRAAIATSRGQPGRVRELVARARALQGDRGGGARLSIGWNLATVAWMEGRIDEAEREMAGLVAEGRAAGLPHLAISAGAMLARVQRSRGRLRAA